jgi:hypothetical protein
VSSFTLAPDTFKAWSKGSTLKLTGISVNFSQDPINNTNNKVFFFEKDLQRCTACIPNGCYTIDQVLKSVEQTMNKIGKQIYKIFLDEEGMCVIESKEEFVLVKVADNIWDILGFTSLKEDKISIRKVSMCRPLLSPEGLYNINLFSKTFDCTIPVILSGCYNNLASCENVEFQSNSVSSTGGAVTVILTDSRGFVVPLKRDWSIIVQQVIA